MTPDQYNRAAEIFRYARMRGLPERDAFLAEACGTDRELRAAVEQLLAHDEAAAQSAESEFVGAGAQFLADRIDANLGEAAALGASGGEQGVPERLGRYRIVRKIGEGGMGIVYEAEQEKPRRTVALKVIKSGITSRESLRRFEHEAQVLGLLQHPGIAQIFEAGTADTGHGTRPFFAMELTHGRALTEYAVAHHLGTRERLELMLEVCDAVQHAHLKGVIHRDLKPGNILVDDSRHPKILDFGVARATNVDMQVTTLQTDVGQLIGTVAYMSPEQVDGDPRTIDTRSDVYSLGVVLYELLCHELPYDVSSMSLVRAARLIQDAPPRRPSSINRALRGDLETITLKALEKSRERRYQSAAELAQEFRRYLAKEPITARSPSTLHKLGLYARRNRAAFAAMVTTALSLIAAVIVSATFAVHAEKEHVVAEEARRHAAARATESEAARAEAEAQRAVAERREYIAHIVAAEAALRVNDVAEARQRLEQAPPARRNWEWWHLRNRLDQSVCTFYGHDDFVIALAFSPDSALLASGSGGSGLRLDYSVRLWDVATTQQVAVTRAFAHFTRVAFSPDGSRVAAGTSDGAVKLLDVATGKEIASSSGRWGRVRGLTFTPGGKLLAASCDDENKTVHVWDALTRDSVADLQGHTELVGALTFSAACTRAVSASRDRTARVWDLESAKEIAKLVGHTAPVDAVALSPQGTQVATASQDGVVRLWDLPSGQEVRALTGHTAAVRDVAYSPDGGRIASASNDRTVKVWDSQTGRKPASLRGHALPVERVAFSPDGKWLATGSADNTVKLWDAAQLEDIPTLHGHWGEIRSLAFSPDSKRLASGSFDSTIKLWDVAARTLVATLRGGTVRVMCVAFSPDGRRVASASSDGTVGIWDADARELATTFTGHADSIHGLAFSYDGTKIASGSKDKSLRLWDAATGEELTTIRGHVDSVNSVVFSPDGIRLASASQDNSVRLWDVASGSELAMLRGHTYEVRSVAFSPDGARLASASSDSTVRVWDAATGEKIATLRGHGNHVYHVAFSPDGTRLASVAWDGTLKLWDPATSEAVVTLRCDHIRVSSVAFSPDGTLIATGGFTGSEHTIKLWEAGPSGDVPQRPTHAGSAPESPNQ